MTSTRSRHFLRTAHPLLWLLALEVLVFHGLGDTRLLEPIRSPDAISYEVPSAADSMEELLSATRTFGYPLLLRLVAPEELDYGRLPGLHAIAFLASVAFFWHAVRLYTGSGWLALSAAFPLTLTTLLRFTQFVQPDVLAPAIAVFGVSFLLLVSVRPSNYGLWIGLVLSVFLAYQTKPAYVFLVVLVPLVGPLLYKCRETISTVGLRKFSLALVVSTLVPFLLFCGLRWRTVGHFGLVSFGGYELIGIAACFLDPELVDDLAPEDRRIAAEILRERQRRNWKPLRPDDAIYAWHKQYGKNQWFIAEPLARPVVVEERQQSGRAALDRDAVYLEMWEGHAAPPLSGAISIAINDRLSRLSWEIIKRRPVLYVKWIYDSLLMGFDQVLVVSTWMRWLPVLIVLSLPVLAVRYRGDREPMVDVRRRLGGSWRKLSGLCVLALVFLMGKLSLMILVSWAQERYLIAGLMFMPAVLTALLFEIWRLILAPLPGTRSGGVSGNG